MPINILLPALSPTMEEGTLAKWLVREGDTVTPGTVIAEIETDKATMEFEAADEGVLGRIVVPEGTEGVKVNELIAVLLEEGEDASELTAEPAPEPATAPAAPPPGKADAPEPAPRAPATSAPAADGGRTFASPLARRIAAEKGIDLGALQGSGPNGRIVKADVLAAKPGAAAAPDAPAPERAAAPAAAPDAAA